MPKVIEVIESSIKFFQCFDNAKQVIKSCSDGTVEGSLIGRTDRGDLIINYKVIVPKED